MAGVIPNFTYAAVVTAVLLFMLRQFASVGQNLLGGKLHQLLSRVSHWWRRKFTGQPRALLAATCDAILILAIGVVFLIGAICNLPESKGEPICVGITFFNARGVGCLLKLIVVLAVVFLACLWNLQASSISIGDKRVPILADCVNLQHVIECEHFQNWLRRIAKDGRIDISLIEIQCLEMINDALRSRIGFLKFKVDASLKAIPNDPNAHIQVPNVPGIVFMSGPAVAVLILVTYKDKLYALLTRRPRVQIPSVDMTEIPTTRLRPGRDAESEACDVLEKLLGIVFPFRKGDLMDLTAIAYPGADNWPGIYPTCGGSDEFLHMFIYQHRRALSEEDFHNLMEYQGGRFSTVVVKYENLITESVDMKCACAVFLFERCVRIGKVKPLIRLSTGRFKNPFIARDAQLKEQEQLSTRPARKNSQIEQTAGRHTKLNIRSASGGGIDTEVAKQSFMFNQWRTALENLDATHINFHVNSIEVQSMDERAPNSPLFLQIKVKATYEQEELPGIVFMRGGSVAVLVLLKMGNTLYTVLTKQPRIPVAASEMLEIPAGMAPGGLFHQFASRELREETGIKVRPDRLIDMSQLLHGNTSHGLYPSCDKSDEYNRFYLYYQEINPEDMSKLKDKYMKFGNSEEGEYIKLRIIEYKKLWTTSADAKALAASHLYETLHKWKKLPDWIPRPPEAAPPETAQAIDPTDEQTQAKNIFKQLDRNGDGHVTKSELKQSLQRNDEIKHCLYLRTNQDCSFLIDSADEDLDGKMCVEEFTAYWIRLCRFRDDAEELFTRLDIDSDGYVTRKDLRGSLDLEPEIAERLNLQNSRDCEKLIKTVDENSDGKISLDEFTQYWVRFCNAQQNAVACAVEVAKREEYADARSRSSRGVGDSRDRDRHRRLRSNSKERDYARQQNRSSRTHGRNDTNASSQSAHVRRRRSRSARGIDRTASTTQQSSADDWRRESRRHDSRRDSRRGDSY